MIKQLKTLAPVAVGSIASLVMIASPASAAPVSSLKSTASTVTVHVYSDVPSTDGTVCSFGVAANGLQPHQDGLYFFVNKKTHQAIGTYHMPPADDFGNASTTFEFNTVETESIPEGTYVLNFEPFGTKKTITTTFVVSCP